MQKCTQCEDHVRLIREVQAALIRAGKETRAGYVGRFAECIDEMAQEIRHLTTAALDSENSAVLEGTVYNIEYVESDKIVLTRCQ